MSYVWLPVDVNLLQNHKTARLSRDLKCSRAQVIGHLVCLWSWACVHAPDGDLSHLEAEDVATVAEWDGDLEAFLPAVIKAGFIARAHSVSLGRWQYISVLHQFWGWGLSQQCILELKPLG